MRHANLFLAAATVLFGTAALRAEPLPASNSTAISTPDLGPSAITVPADSTPAPAVARPSPVAEIAAQPQEVESGPIRRVAHAVVPPYRPVTHRARLGCFCAHRCARLAKRAIMPRRFAAPQAAVWLTASSEPRYVVLGVGF
jgi:hypothetical protein